MVLVVEFCTGGDLLRLMYKCGGRLLERQAVNMVLQPFLTALHYLHTQGIVHRWARGAHGGEGRRGEGSWGEGPGLGQFWGGPGLGQLGGGGEGREGKRRQGQ